MAPTTTTLAGPPVAADSPAGLAVQIIEAERAIRDPSTPPAALARAGHTQQVVYGRLSVREQWQAEVVDLVAADLRPIVEANLRAVTDLTRQASADVAANGGPTRELPDWRIVTPPPPSELLAEYRAAEAATGAPWEYLAAIHLVETRMGRIRGNSIAGAQGPMQFIPSTWDIYGGGGDINDTHDAILAAGRMLRANGAPSNMATALYSYNPSNRYVRAVTRSPSRSRPTSAPTSATTTGRCTSAAGCCPRGSAAEGHRSYGSARLEGKTPHQRGKCFKPPTTLAVGRDREQGVGRLVGVVEAADERRARPAGRWRGSPAARRPVAGSNQSSTSAAADGRPREQGGPPGVAGGQRHALDLHLLVADVLGGLAGPGVLVAALPLDPVARGACRPCRTTRPCTEVLGAVGPPVGDVGAVGDQPLAAPVVVLEVLDEEELLLPHAAAAAGHDAHASSGCTARW